MLPIQELACSSDVEDAKERPVVLAVLGVDFRTALLHGVMPNTAEGIGFALGMPLLGALVAAVASLFRRELNVPKAMCVASAIGFVVAVLTRLTTRYAVSVGRLSIGGTRRVERRAIAPSR